MSNNNAIAIGELQTILHSRVFYEVLEQHKLHLQGEVNRFVKLQDHVNAYASARAMEDVGKIVELLHKKLEDFKK